MAAPAPFPRRCKDCLALETTLSAAVAQHDRAFNEWLDAVNRDQDLLELERALTRAQSQQDRARRAFTRHNRKCIVGAARRRYVFATSTDAEQFAAYCRGQNAHIATPTPQSVDIRAADDGVIGHYDRIALLAGASGPVFIETSSGSVQLLKCVE